MNSAHTADSNTTDNSNDNAVIVVEDLGEGPSG